MSEEEEEEDEEETETETETETEDETETETEWEEEEEEGEEVGQDGGGVDISSTKGRLSGGGDGAAGGGEGGGGARSAEVLERETALEGMVALIPSVLEENDEIEYID